MDLGTSKHMTRNEYVFANIEYRKGLTYAKIIGKPSLAIKGWGYVNLSCANKEIKILRICIWRCTKNLLFIGWIGDTCFVMMFDNKKMFGFYKQRVDCGIGYAW